MPLLRSSLLVLAFLAPIPLSAHQTIPLESVPRARGDQFDVLPAANLGLGLMEVAKDDQFRDPFTNPAVHGGGRGLRFFLTPSIYGNVQSTVAGRSLPMSATIAGDRWFGAVSFALQEIEDNPEDVLGHPSSLDQGLDYVKDGKNTYFLGSLGRRVGAGSSIGFQFSRADLGMLEGIRWLYPAAVNVAQDGNRSGVKIGFTQRFGDFQDLRIAVSRTRTEVRQDVTNWRWLIGEFGDRTPETSLDQDQMESTSWAGRVRYSHLVPYFQMRLSGAVTVQRTDQEVVPRYHLVAVPRDPGTSTSVEVAIGVETEVKGGRLVGELGIVPGTADTRALADTAFSTPGGEILNPGDPALDSHFRFLNWRAAGGVEVPVGEGAVQLGIEFHTFSYRLEQDDHMFSRERERNESWTEWTPSAGFRTRIGPMHLGYAVSFMARGSAPCETHSYRSFCKLEPTDYHKSHIRVAPTDPDNLPDYRLTTHSFTVGFQLGR